jgi:hypothetical protein
VDYLQTVLLQGTLHVLFDTPVHLESGLLDLSDWLVV